MSLKLLSPAIRQPVWRPGEALQDVYSLALPADLAPGQYSLRFGFYDAAGRVPLAEAALTASRSSGH